MSEYQHSQDQKIKERLRELGKQPDCTCEITFETVAGRHDVDLFYKIDCPVHFPETSAFLEGCK